MRDLEHIAPVLDRVLGEAAELELKHAKPRALDAVSRAREASYQVRTPHQTEAPARKRFPAGSVDRGTVCPSCDAAATKQGSKIECSWCGLVSQRDEKGVWRVVDSCRMADGSWPDRDKQESST
jgi:Zn ribbon nucleic-acid-binding protein